MRNGSPLRNAADPVGHAGRGHTNMRRAEMRYAPPALVLMAAMMLQAPPAHAIPIVFQGTLSGANEVPPISPAGTGTVKVVLDPTAETLELAVTFTSLTSL